VERASTLAGVAWRMEPLITM